MYLLIAGDKDVFCQGRKCFNKINNLAPKFTFNLKSMLIKPQKRDLHHSF
ncbi:hypothetical protein O59_000233 [Cellvibrio sp. BR]|nr:hypothetical protein O59_000233 [Cellvibrio sp. BR]